MIVDTRNHIMKQNKAGIKPQTQEFQNCDVIDKLKEKIFHFAFRTFIDETSAGIYNTRLDWVLIFTTEWNWLTLK